jgi:hypothetical protein
MNTIIILHAFKNPDNFLKVIEKIVIFLSIFESFYLSLCLSVSPSLSLSVSPDAYLKIFGTSIDPKLMNTVIILHAFKNPDNFLKV